MARALAAEKVLHRMTGVFWLEDTAPTATITAGVAKGGTVVTLTAGDVAALSLADGDEIRIGNNGNLAEINIVDGAPAGEVVTLQIPVGRAIGNTEVFTKLTATDLGCTDENGITFATTQDETAVICGTQRQTYLFIGGNIDQALTFALRDFEVENIAKMFGMDEADSTIIDTTGPVKSIMLNPDDFTTFGNAPFKFEGLLEDNTPVVFFVFSAKVAVVNGDISAVFGTATILPVNMRANGNSAAVIG